MWSWRKRWVSNLKPLKKFFSHQDLYPLLFLLLDFPADRRPIDPAPIVQLRVITHDKPLKSLKKSSKENPTSIESGDSSRNEDQGRRGQKVITEEGIGWEDKAWYLENPYFFMLAILVDANAGEFDLPFWNQPCWDLRFLDASRHFLFSLIRWRTSCFTGW